MAISANEKPATSASYKSICITLSLKLYLLHQQVGHCSPVWNCFVLVSCLTGIIANAFIAAVVCPNVPHLYLSIRTIKIIRRKRHDYLTSIIPYGKTSKKADGINFLVKFSSQGKNMKPFHLLLRTNYTIVLIMPG